MKQEQYNLQINRYESGLMIIKNAQLFVGKLQSNIEEEEPKLKILDQELTEKRDKLKIILDETEIKKEEVNRATDEQNIKVEELTKMTNEIKNEKSDTEKEKREALNLADKLSNKDLIEINSYNNPPETICYCLKIIVLLFEEESNVKNKESLKEWFNVFKSKLMTNINEFKEKLKIRIKDEQITERQFKKIETIYDPSKFETNY